MTGWDTMWAYMTHYPRGRTIKKYTNRQINSIPPPPPLMNLTNAQNHNLEEVWKELNDDLAEHNTTTTNKQTILLPDVLSVAPVSVL